jgi:hypothetical protein
MVEIIVRPNRESRNGRYIATVDGVELANSVTPFFAAARVVIAQGRDPSEIAVMKHEGSETVCLRARLGVAANLTVAEPADGHMPTFQSWYDPNERWARNAE